jgi:peptidoglycan/LPS O-acetylase OafA/YrhL
MSKTPLDSLPKVTQFLTLDAFRGMAALWVVMDHACIPYITGDGSQLRNSALYWISSFGSLGVVLFFVLSGYCIAGAVYQALVRGSSPFQFARDRIRRIYPPYLAACLLDVFLVWALAGVQQLHLIPQSNHHTNLSHGWVYWIANASITQIELRQPCLVIVFWSLCYEIVFYAIMGGILAAFRPFFLRGCISETRIIRLFSLTLFLITGISLGCMITAPTRCPFPLNLWYQFGIGSLLFFALLKLTISGKNSASWLNPRWHLGCLLLMMVTFAWIQNITFIDGLALHEFVIGKPSTRIQALTAVIFVLLLLLIHPFDSRAVLHPFVRAFSFLGTISYSLYLIHTLVQPFVDAGLRKLGFSGSLYLYNFLSQVVFSMIAGFVFYQLVERHFISSRHKKRMIAEHP